jgi:hypothetical protein
VKYDDGVRPIVSVAGATSRAGKTALAVTLVESQPRGSVEAVKFTTTEDVFERCPRGTPCVVCDIDVPFRIIEDDATLGQPGTDTARLQAAGAARVIWAIAKAGAVPEAWRAVERRLRAGLVVMEGSTIVDVARPELLLFVVHPHLAIRRWKPQSAALLARADAVVVNRPTREQRAPNPEVLDAIRSARGAREPLVVDVQSPIAGWGASLERRLRDLNSVESPIA